MPRRRSLAQILADDPELAAALRHLEKVAGQCWEIVVDDSMPPKKKRVKKRKKP